MTKSKVIVRNILLVFLTCVMFFSSTGTVNAALKDNNEASPCYTYISYDTINLTISGITAHCTATLHTSKSVKLTIKMELQKKKSTGYETVETWTDSKNGTYLALSESRAINILCDYRLKVTYTAASETEVAYKY